MDDRTIDADVAKTTEAEVATVLDKGLKESNIASCVEPKVVDKENLLEKREVQSEEVIDLDYDEVVNEEQNENNESENSLDDGEIDDSAEDREMSASNLGETEKEDGELEDGELTDSEDGEISSQERVNCVKNEAKVAGKKFLPIAQKRAVPAVISKSSSNKLTSWERGLREAREAMKRASKVREEPDFQTKRLVAAPSGDRLSQEAESDSDDPSRDRRSSRSPLSPTRRIPSLLDLQMSPPRFLRRQPKAIANRRMLYSPGRRKISPMDDRDVSTSPHLNDLGPQVIYPNGRPESGRRERSKVRRRRESPPGPPRRIGSPVLKRRMTPPVRERVYSPSRTGRRTNIVKRSPDSTKGLSPVRDASPISSDSDSDKKFVSTKRVGQGAMDNVSDPWARKKKPQIVAEKAKERVEKRGKKFKRNRSFSRSRSSSVSSSSDSSRRKRRGKKRSRRSPSSSSQSSSHSSNASDQFSTRSPPRGDISSFRIPKKRQLAGCSTSFNGHQRNVVAPTTSYRDQVDEFFAKKPSDIPAAFRPKKHRKSRKSSSPVSPSKHAEVISNSDDSPSDHNRSSRSSSVASSSSSKSHSDVKSRSPSPALPAKYRVESEVVKAGSLSPVSEDESGKPRISSRHDVDGKRCASPPPPPPPEQPEQCSSNTSPPPPPPPVDTAPPKEKRRKSHEKAPSASSTKVRRRELLQQLRAVEAELQRKKEAVQAGSAH